LRTAVIDLQSLECRSSWSVENRVVVGADKSERGWNTGRPGFARIVEQLSKTAIGEILVKKLGLQRSLYVWRTEPGVVVLAELSSIGSLPASNVDVQLMKEICSAAINASKSAAASGQREAASSALSSIDPRSRSARARWVKAGGACVLSMLACAALGVWLFAKKSHLEILHVRTLMDRAMLRSLSLALAKSDYGEVQEMLSTYADSGYFSQEP